MISILTNIQSRNTIIKLQTYSNTCSQHTTKDHIIKSDNSTEIGSTIIDKNNQRDEQLNYT